MSGSPKTRSDVATGAEAEPASAGAKTGTKEERVRAKRDRSREKMARAAEKQAVRRSERSRAAADASTAELDRAARSAFFEKAAEQTQYLGVEVEGATFLVATRDRGVDRSLFLKRGRPEFMVLARAVAIVESLLGSDAIQGRILVDVGANIGTEVVAALLSHGFGTAVCFEPDEETFRQLCANLALNGLETRARALRLGASDKTGRTSFVHIEGSAGNNWVASESQIETAKHRAQRLTEDPDPDAPRLQFQEVEVDTLDRLCETGVIAPERVGLLWIDAEGHEGHVLSGAQALVERGVPIVTEFHPKRIERGGKFARFEEAARSYTHVVDLRRGSIDPSQPRLRLRPIADLPEIAEQLLDPEISWNFTDLLLLRLEDGQVPESTDLDPVIKSAKAARAKDAGSGKEAPRPEPEEPSSD
jgi:FkbM family methyltransferase